MGREVHVPGGVSRSRRPSSVQAQPQDHGQRHLLRRRLHRKRNVSSSIFAAERTKSQFLIRANWSLLHNVGFDWEVKVNYCRFLPSLWTVSIFLEDLLALGVENGIAELHPSKYRVVRMDQSYCGEIQVGLTFNLRVFTDHILSRGSIKLFSFWSR